MTVMLVAVLATTDDVRVAETITGSSNEYLGQAIASAGDVDNDGYDDLVVGCQSYNSSTGRAAAATRHLHQLRHRGKVARGASSGRGGLIRGEGGASVGPQWIGRS